MFSKPIVFGKLCPLIILAASILIAQNIPVATASGDAAPGQTVKSPDSSSAPQQAQKEHLALCIDDVNDIGYALQRIRQQAINIYIEATRKRDSPEISAELPSVCKVSAEIPSNMTNLLPFRRPWLVYFTTTLEPLIHLLKEDVKAFETGATTFDVSPETRKALDPLIKEWSLGVGKMGKELTAATELAEDAEKNNVEIAKIAYELDKEVGELEKVRDKAFCIVSEMEPKGKHLRRKAASD